MTKIEVLQPGLFSTIQDLGRFGYMNYGVPMSGAMDQYAATMANLLLKNPPDAALLEITLSGPKLQFHGFTEIVITGGDLSPVINEKPIGNHEVIFVQAGDVLSFRGRRSGCRTYLGVSGGFETEVALGSRSWFEDITGNFRLKKGTSLYVGSILKSDSSTFSSLKVETAYFQEKELRVFPGPEYSQLPEQIQKNLQNQSFTVGENSNRMGIQLREQLKNELSPIITGPVLPGTVQLTPSGNLIILMRDCQTTGGYPRILQLSDKALNVLAQKIPGDEVRFSVRDFMN